jgi:molecular chaperone GrpE
MSDVKVVDRRWWAREQDDEGAAADAAPGKPTYVEELEQRIQDKDREIRDITARYREAAHEFDAMRARMRKEVARDAERSRRTMLVDLLEVVDNLDRAIDAARQGADGAAVLQGVEMVRAQFLQKLDGLGVRRIDAAGCRFDPERHDAVAIVPASDAAPDGVVVGVVAHGYSIGDEVLRPAQVAVARAEEQP